MATKMSAVTLADRFFAQIGHIFGFFFEYQFDCSLSKHRMSHFSLVFDDLRMCSVPE